MTDVSNVEILSGPWKQHVTAAERFEELAIMARKEPEKFNEVMVLWCSTREKGMRWNWCEVGMDYPNTPQGWHEGWQRILGFLALAKHAILDYYDTGRS